MAKSKASTKTTNEYGEAMKTYVLELQNGELRRVTVPETWKLTFGPTIPYAGKYTGQPSGTALRFYQGNKDNLRAIFTDVKSFRDESIEVLERRTEIHREVVQQHGKDGVKNVEVAAHVTQWFDPNLEKPSTSVAQPPNQYMGLLPSRAG